MRRLWGTSQPSAAERLAGLAEKSGDLAAAMHLLLSGVTPEDRVTLARELLPHLPGIMGATVLGDSFTAEEWPALRNAMSSEERRPVINGGLVAYGRKHFALDLALVPENTKLHIQGGIFTGLVKNPRLTTPEHLPSAPINIEMRAVGDGVYELSNALYIPLSPRESHRFELDDPVRLGNMTATRHGKQFTSVIRHGRPLFTVIDQQPFEIHYHDPHNGLRECYLANIALDGVQVFHGPDSQNR